jgi:hypothetical protein
MIGCEFSLTLASWPSPPPPPPSSPSPPHPSHLAFSWVLGGVDSRLTPGGLGAALSRRASVSSSTGKKADRQHSSEPVTSMVDSRSSKTSALFEGVLFKTGKGIVGKSFFQPRRVRITNGMLM